jgi:hypothetical protein
VPDVLTKFWQAVYDESGSCCTGRQASYALDILRPARMLQHTNDELEHKINDLFIHIPFLQLQRETLYPLLMAQREHYHRLYRELLSRPTR